VAGFVVLVGLVTFAVDRLLGLGLVFLVIATVVVVAGTVVVVAGTVVVISNGGGPGLAVVGGAVGVVRGWVGKGDRRTVVVVPAWLPGTVTLRIACVVGVSKTVVVVDVGSVDDVSSPAGGTSVVVVEVDLAVRIRWPPPPGHPANATPTTTPKTISSARTRRWKGIRTV